MAGDQASLWHAGELLATAAPVRPSAGRLPAPAEPLDWLPADQPEESFAGFRRHPFPSCFVCGTDRADGMRLFPVPAPGRPDTVVAGWTPAPELADGSGLVRPEFVWAALDCPGGWSAMPVASAGSAGPAGPSGSVQLAGSVELSGSVQPAERPETLVLSRLAVRLLGRPRQGRPHVVVGRLDRRAGRMAWARTALFDEHRTVLATGQALWISVDPASFQATGGAE